MTFYFYDLETSGLHSGSQRIMQFGGIRTDENLNIIDEPFECYVKLTDEILPDPAAIMVTGISPQQANDEGYTEPEFIKILNKKVFTPDTVIVGYNNIRFDDEFIRNLFWRNLRDPYEWHWRDGRSRWDLVDPVRMTRALRPDGVEWPVDDSGKPTNRLEKLTEVNSIEHSGAHTALADVEALIKFAKVLKEKQPKLFDFLLKTRSKKSVADIVNIDSPAPFVHSSGKLSSEFLSTSVFMPIFADSTNPQSIVCFDLRYDATELNDLSEDELLERMFAKREEREEKSIPFLPVKGIHVNKCPAVAPLGVLDEAAQERISLDIETIQANLAKLKSASSFIATLKKALKNNQPNFDNSDVDLQLYDGFLGDKDRFSMMDFHKSKAYEKFEGKFIDDRINQLLFRYKARNDQAKLGEDQMEQWQEYRLKRLSQGMPGSLSVEEYLREISRLREEKSEDKKALFLLEELELYLQSIA